MIDCRTSSSTLLPATGGAPKEAAEIGTAPAGGTALGAGAEIAAVAETAAGFVEGRSRTDAALGLTEGADVGGATAGNDVAGRGAFAFET